MGEIITSKKQLKEWLDYEFSKYGKRYGFLDMFEITEGSIIRKHQFLLRKAEYFVNTKKKIRSIYYRVRLYKLQSKYSLHVVINACGKGLKIMHVGPILMNGKTKIGQDCSIHINTSFVAGGTNDEAPVVGNGVIVGVGAVLVGGVKIADNVAIGANAVVNKNVEEENIAVAGVPAKKISNNGSSAWNKGGLK